jgi:two-component system, OmpR family, response regulator VicR
MMRKAKILYVEDDLTLSFVTRDNLNMKGYDIDFCEDGIKAFEMWGTGHYDLCILDVMLPKMDGFTLAQKIREKDHDVPIIFLTARSAKEDRIQGLSLGADDYIVKPFSIEELILKIEVFLKRSKITSRSEGKSSIVRLGCLTFDPGNQLLTDGDKLHPFTQRETELFMLLFENRNSIVKREEILQKIWGNDHFFSSRSLDVFISRIRKYLKPEPGIRIENVHNVGYRLKTTSE